MSNIKKDRVETPPPWAAFIAAGLVAIYAALFDLIMHIEGHLKGKGSWGYIFFIKAMISLWKHDPAAIKDGAILTGVLLLLLGGTGVALYELKRAKKDGKDGLADTKDLEEQTSRYLLSVDAWKKYLSPYALYDKAHILRPDLVKERITNMPSPTTVTRAGKALGLSTNPFPHVPPSALGSLVGVNSKYPDGGEVWLSYERSILLYGPPRSGKNYGFFNGWVATHDGPAICTAVRADVFATTAHYRDSKGQVYLFDPFNLCVTDPLVQSGKVRTVKWSPLWRAEEISMAIQHADVLANAAKAGGGSDKQAAQEYYSKQCAQVMAAALHVTAIKGGSLDDALVILMSWGFNAPTYNFLTLVRDLLPAGSQARFETATLAPPPGLNNQARSAPRPPAERAQEAAQQARMGYEQPEPVERVVTVEDRFRQRRQPAAPVADYGGIEKGAVFSGQHFLNQLETVYLALVQTYESSKQETYKAFFASVMTNVLAPIQHPAMRAAMLPEADGKFFDPSEFLAGKNTLYIVGAEHDQAMAAPVIVGLIQDVTMAAQEKISQDVRHPRLVPPLGLYLDELPSIAPLPEETIRQFLSTGAGSGIRFVGVIQDIAFAEQRWGQKLAETLVSTSGAVVILPGVISDLCQKLSNIAGQGFVEMPGGKEGEPSRRQLVPLLRPEQIRQIKAGNALVFISNLAPVEVTSVPYDVAGWYKHAQATSSQS